MRSGPLAILAILMVATVAFGAGDGSDLVSRVPGPDMPTLSEGGYRGVRLETLWIFCADFEDESTWDAVRCPDISPGGQTSNAGWTSYDRSGTLAQENYWHRDTVRVPTVHYPYLGLQAWWCGTYNICWRQPRGYGNEWLQILKRTLTAGEMGTGGDLVELEWDQRYAMERNYDYGYVEVSNDGGANWSTLAAYNNTGFQGAGVPHNWNHPTDGHVVHDISTYAGQQLELRYRFESDVAYSSQDQYDNSQHSVKDGAWQLDNITLSVNGSPTFYDDSETEDPGWVHEDTEQTGNTTIQFKRGQFGIDYITGREFTCDNRPFGKWCYAAVDPFTKTMVEGEDTWLISPPIDIEGAGKLVGQWDMWVDLPRPTNDIFNLQLASNDLYECVTDPAGFVDEDPGWWYGGPFFGVWTDDWDAFAGNSWLAIMWQLRNDDPSEDTPPHRAGVILFEQRVGIPSGDAGTTFERDTWEAFNDWFVDDLADAFLDTGRIRVKDDDGIQSLYVLASNDGGQTWDSYEATREAPESDWWDYPPPENQLVPAAEIRYYFEATDGVGTVTTYPSDAPRRYYEMSILPLDPATEILLVDKHGRLMPGDERDYRHSSEYYYREALEIMGYEYETYDVEVPSGSIKSEGPPLHGQQYYDTQIWFANEFDSYTLWRVDQRDLIQWLSEASAGAERNLLLTGNDIGKELIATGQETSGFYTTWLASEYVANSVGIATVDSVPGLEDRAAGWTFFRDDGDPETDLDGDAALNGGCPSLNYFDVVDARPGLPGNEVVGDYCKIDGSKVPAGVAYTHPTIGYQTVNLGFGMEFMVDGDCVATGPFTHAYYDGSGHFMTGVHARADLMDAIMDYFGQAATGPGTGVPEGALKNVLSHAAPNPFNPVTKIAYSVKEAGPVTIEVYNVAGRVVRTLLDTELEAGTDGYVTWDGTNDRGERCASGVYFYRIQAPDFSASRKMVMLK
jgi:hypothetical protein